MDTRSRIFPLFAWVIAIALIAVAVWAWMVKPQIPLASRLMFGEDAPIVEESQPPTQQPVVDALPSSVASLPPVNINQQVQKLSRFSDPHTIIPTRPRYDVVDYTVDQGDSVFGIASYFNIKPETVLWANYDQLNDSPDFLEPGMELRIPPVDGVYYEWKEGDYLEAVALKFEAEVSDIIYYQGNQFDLLDPKITAGQQVMIPGGKREFKQWLIPTIARGSAGVNNSALGPGACSGPFSGAYGSGAFIWPTGNHYLSGNDYWSGHLGLDLAAGMGAGLYAADAGVVVFAGWANGGYGYTVMIDHGNGYQTLYAHMSVVTIGCGSSVGAGTPIGQSGSTGNSTGAHLHFEVRLNGGFINPWFVLPAP